MVGRRDKDQKKPSDTGKSGTHGKQPQVLGHSPSSSARASGSNRHSSPVLPDTRSKRTANKARTTYACEHCTKRFFAKSDLNFHFRSKHSKEKRGTGTHSADDSSLPSGPPSGSSSRIERTPTTPRRGSGNKRTSTTTTHPHVCNMCGKGFRQEKDLTQHMKIEHTVEKLPALSDLFQRPKCKICGLQFRLQKELKEHRDLHHQYKCSSCASYHDTAEQRLACETFRAADVGEGGIFGSR